MLGRRNAADYHFDKQLGGGETMEQIQSFVNEEQALVKELGREKYLKMLLDSQSEEVKDILRKGPLGYLLQE